MGNLPAKRIQFTRPFVHTGVDYCGPFFEKERRHRNRNKIKCYVAVFVCLASKATHLELVSDLTTEAFLAALKRFFARCGKSSSLISDNATMFEGASRELAELQVLLLCDEHNRNIQEFLANQRVNWSFIPPCSPHFGGLWQAGVKSFKNHLKRTEGEALLTFEQLQTYIIEIEAILNSRPLSPLSSDPNDCRPLTPGHFLIGEPLTNFSQANLTHIAVNRLSAWKHVQMLRQHIWIRWHKEYLNELTTRTKWKTGSSDDITIGSLVVMKEDNAPPLHWKLGRIILSNPGKDGVVRVVSLKTETGIYKRSVKGLCPLPIEESVCHDSF
ncbi:uncharacterized protein LOC117168016 [Belonocnema kinseyi]|uniref:uncharacterized protein LOC117168016 n=1 Tax=Belonocnema kinseyi TaxID=2817044 RepID=UPI00143DE05A|nr:uncharacterized protein LOC117168016 [Belonocnema kinseyi]